MLEKFFFALQESGPHVSIDDAFASLERLMVTSSRACKVSCLAQTIDIMLRPLVQ